MSQHSISKDKLEELFETAITDTRDNWRLLCPYHLESTPSFYIHKDDLVGHCFGCGIAGRLDVLLAKFLGCSASQARQALGLKSLPWLDEKGREVEPEPTFPNVWIKAWKRIATHPYLERRGFEREVISHFELRWDPVTKRVVWPLNHREGKVVGAVGRATDGREPKYLFYWNCDKGQSVWTAKAFWQETSQHDRSVIVVEGILDCMWMWQNGMQNTVSLIGAHATLAQTKQLKEFDTVIIGLDNDKAGRAGALDLGDALRASCEVQYALYPHYASDANDLQFQELQEIFSNTVTPLEMKLYGNCI